MKHAVWFAAALWWAWSAAAGAQDQIYESTGKGGVPEFSGQPTPGSNEITLPPPNVIETTPAPAQPAPQEVLTGYSQLAILFPDEQGTLHTNTGAFDVRVAVEPTLNPGDAFMVTLDGTALPGRYKTADIAVTEQDFESAATDDVQHRLEVAVVDAAGKVLITAGPVNFYVHRATVRRSVR
jgi:hypothetical protein